jgi:hypothetical protein
VLFVCYPYINIQGLFSFSQESLVEENSVDVSKLRRDLAEAKRKLVMLAKKRATELESAQREIESKNVEIAAKAVDLATKSALIHDLQSALALAKVLSEKMCSCCSDHNYAAVSIALINKSDINAVYG